MTENVKKVLELKANDEEFAKKLDAIAKDEDVIALAKEKGIELTVDEIVAAKSEVSDDDLDSVAGGYAGYDAFTPWEYAEAGVHHEHNIFVPDTYEYKGHRITQGEAEGITRGYKIDNGGFKNN